MGKGSWIGEVAPPNTTQPAPMLSTIITALKSPRTYVILAIGIVLACYSLALRQYGSKVAAYLPGAKPPTT